MFKKISAMVVILLSISANWICAENYRLPLEGGKKYQLTVGYDGKSIFFNNDGTPFIDTYHLGNSKFSLDFDNPPNDDDVIIVAIADGIVEQLYLNPTTSYGYGVKIKHADGCRSIYAHFKEKPLVSQGNSIYQGQSLGKMGTTGYSSGTHLHFELRNSSGITIKPEPMSGYTNFTAGTWYTSDNYIFPIGRYSDGWHTDGTSQAFVDCFTKFSAFLGSSFDNGGGIYVHRVGIVWAQDIEQDMCKPHYGDDGKCCLILNENKGKAFLVKEGFWGKYKEVWGFDNLGAACNNEYVGSIRGTAIIRQNFEKGYMTWDGSTVNVYWGNYQLPANAGNAKYASKTSGAIYSLAVMPTANSASLMRVDQAVKNFFAAAFTPVAPATVVLQPCPCEGAKDIWVTNVYSYAPGGGGPGGGLDNHELRVGGWGDSYYSLIQFDLSDMPPSAKSAKLFLYNAANQGTPTGMYLDRITTDWSWAKGDRLWWENKPTATQVSTIPAPKVNAWCEIDITAIYNDWQSGTYQNYGLQLRPQCDNNNWNEFYSSDNLDMEMRPKLIITN